MIPSLFVIACIFAASGQAIAACIVALVAIALAGRHRLFN